MADRITTSESKKKKRDFTEYPVCLLSDDSIVIATGSIEQWAIALIDLRERHSKQGNTNVLDISSYLTVDL